MSEPKRFEDWNIVDCNECSHYWDNSCDGVSKDNKRVCNSFIATRNVVIPEQIKRLQKVVKGLLWGFSGITVSLIIHYLGILLSW